MQSLSDGTENRLPKNTPFTKVLWICSTLVLSNFAVAEDLMVTAVGPLQTPAVAEVQMVTAVYY